MGKGELGVCLFVLGQWWRNVATEPIGAALELQV